tara:strand:- start:3111 stop:3767 length:657 start_codon:yes stop_codon:yes gene_type:complete
MTLLETVNGLLRRMRENEVASTEDNTYSKMLVDIVNDSKTLVENAYDWTALRSTITFNTVASTTNYSLAGSGDRVKVINVLNDTQNQVIRLTNQTQIDKNQTLNASSEGAPYLYIFRNKDSSGDMTVDLYPTPDAVYSVDFNVIKPQALLVANTNDATEILAPNLPILHLALALAVRERGETGGTSAQEYFNIADGFLSDAIAFDSARQPAEAIWYYV